MYIAVRRYEGAPDTQKVAKLVEEHFVPIISELPGFVAYYLVDAGDGVIATTAKVELLGSSVNKGHAVAMV